MTDIAIKYDDDGQIINRFIGTQEGEEWTITQQSQWPEPSPGANEIPLYYYDEATGTISVQYETVTLPDDPDA